MKEIKSHFKADNRGSGLSWFIIDTDDTIVSKINHVACISCTMGDISYQGYGLNNHNNRYLDRDDKLDKPTMSNYLKASHALMKKGFVFNKKKGIIEERKSLQQ